MGPCIASAAARPMASVVFCKQEVGTVRQAEKRMGCYDDLEWDKIKRPDTCLRFDHLANIILQNNLHGGHLRSNCITQLTRHWL